MTTRAPAPPTGAAGPIKGHGLVEGQKLEPAYISWETTIVTTTSISYTPPAARYAQASLCPWLVDPTGPR
jgi:hypothetical protein